MADFDTGVSGYIFAETLIRVGFPIDRRGEADISCEQCDYFRRSSKSCDLTKKVCAYPSKYVGAHCPLHVVENE